MTKAPTLGQPRLTIGSWVKYKTPSQIGKTFAIGLLDAVETYTDLHGQRSWLYVTWIDDNGKPIEPRTKHHQSELEPLAT